MIIAASSPWKNQTTERWRNIIIVMLFFIGLVASFGAIFTTSYATAQNNGGECQAYTIIGDHQGVQDVNAGLEEKIKSELGVQDVESQTFNGRDINQITKQINSSNLSGRCLIIEGGTGDLKNSKPKMEKDVDKAMKAINSSGAKKVFWVSPVVDDNRAGKDYKPKVFNDVLREKSNGQVNIVNIQELSVRGNLFEDNGVTMTEEGYEQRVDLIVKKVKPIAKPSQTSSPTSSQNNNGGNNNGGNNSGNNNAGNNNGGGNNNNGGGSNAPYVAGPESGNAGGPSNTPSGPGPEKDTQKASPIAISNAITEYGKSNAAQFLIINRWGGFSIASPSFRIDDMESSITGSLTAVISNTLFSVAQFAFSLLVNGMLLIVGDTMPTVGIKIANTFFSWFVGGTAADESKVVPIATALATIAFAFSFMTAIDTKIKMSPRQRVMHVLSSVGKTMLATTMFLFVSYQSSKNHNPNFESELVNEFKESAQESPDIDLDNSNAVKRERTAGDFTSWEPLSLGWFLSLAYFMGNQVASAGFNIGSALVIAPLEGVSSSLDNSVNQTKDSRPACDRYIDAVNLAFRSTTFAGNSPAVATTLSALDFTYVRLVVRPYTYLWGGPTFQAQNSYCRDLERKSGRPPGEIMLMARGAGMWKEAAGSGNIIANPKSSAGKFTNGRHVSTGEMENLSDGLPTGQDGVLVTADGHWQGENKYSAMERANLYIDGGRSLSINRADPGTYYFASCVWEPTRSDSYLIESMNGITAMGATGVSDKDEDLPPYEVEFEAGKFIKESVATSKGIIAGVPGIEQTRGKTATLLDSVEALSGGGDSGDSGDENSDDSGDSNEGSDEKVKIPSPQHRRLNDEDCKNAFVFYLDDINSNAVTGWNSKNQWAERWDYTPLPPPTLSESINAAVAGAAQSAAGNIPGLGFVNKVYNGAKSLGGWAKDALTGSGNNSDGGDNGGEDESSDTLEPIDPEKNPKVNPEFAINESVDDSGHNSAKAFWEYRAGLRSNGDTFGVAMVVVLIGIAMMVLYIFPILFLAAINIVFTIYLIIAGGVLSAGLIVMAFRSAKPKGAR